MEALRWLVRVFLGISGAFFLFVSILQIQDDFVGYGFVSIGIGGILWFLLYRSMKKRNTNF